MPLIKSGSKAAISSNIREMVRAGHPQKQAVAAALSTARRYGRKYQEGGEVEGPELKHTAEGLPFYQNLPTGEEYAKTVIPSPGQPLYQAGQAFMNRLREPQPLKEETTPDYMAERPDETIYGLGKKAIGSIYNTYKDLFDPFSKGEDEKYVAEQPMIPGPGGKVPQATKDITSLGLPIAGDIISNLAGPPGKGALWGAGKAALSAVARAIPESAVKKAEIAIARAASNPSIFSPETMASHLITANRSNPETIAFDLFQLAQRHPNYANSVFDHLPPKMLADVDNFIGEYSNASGIWPFKKVNEDKQVQSFAEQMMNREDIASISRDTHEAMNDLFKQSSQRPHGSDVLESLYPWMKTYRSVIPSMGFGSKTAEFLDKNILPHYNGNLKEFTDQYLGGLYDPKNFDISTTDNGLGMTGRFKTPNGWGSIDRRIFLQRDGSRFAYHGFLQLPEKDQGSDIAKRLLQGQIDLYQKMGLDYVKLSANIDVGGYSWAKYGFLPVDDGVWQDMSYNLFNSIQEMVRSGSIPHQVGEDLLRYTERTDRHALWDFVDHPTKIPPGMYGSTYQRPLKWGQALMMRYGQMRGGWPGKLDLKDQETMERFNAYIQRRK